MPALTSTLISPLDAQSSLFGRRPTRRDLVSHELCQIGQQGAEPLLEIPARRIAGLARALLHEQAPTELDLKSVNTHLRLSVAAGDMASGVGSIAAKAHASHATQAQASAWMSGVRRLA